MRRFSALILAAALTAPILVAAQIMDGRPAPIRTRARIRNRGDLFERVQTSCRTCWKEAEPHLDKLGRDLGDTVNSLRPVLGDIGTLMDDVKNYQAPERLENGDILIRRRADAPPPPPVGDDALREMLRPAPEDDPRLNPREGRSAPPSRSHAA